MSERHSEAGGLHFGTAGGGFLNAVHRNNALSYFVGTDAWAAQPVSLLAGDRNLRVDGFGSCSVGTSYAGAITVGPTVQSAGWTNGLHYPFGNTLHVDGRVEQTSDTTLRHLLRFADEAGAVHVLIP